MSVIELKCKLHLFEEQAKGRFNKVLSNLTNYNRSILCYHNKR